MLHTEIVEKTHVLCLLFAKIMQFVW